MSSVILIGNEDLCFISDFTKAVERVLDEAASEVAVDLTLTFGLNHGGKVDVMLNSEGWAIEFQSEDA